MYVVEHNPADGLIFLETTAERQHAEDQRQEIRGRVEEASELALEIVATQLAGESFRLRSENDRIRVERLAYDRMPWHQRWRHSNPWKDECIARRECHVAWTWIDDGRITRVAGILPAQITVGEYNRLRHYEQTGDLKPHIYAMCEEDDGFDRRFGHSKIWGLTLSDEDMTDVLRLEPNVRYRAWATDIAAETDEADRREHNGR